MTQPQLLDHITETLSGRLGLGRMEVRRVLKQHWGTQKITEQMPRWLDPVVHLLMYRRSGRVDAVSILSARDTEMCELCFAADGTCYTIGEAVEQLPLPHPECQNDICRCNYRPLLDIETA